MMNNFINILGKQKWIFLFFLWFLHGLVSFGQFFQSKYFEVSLKYITLEFVVFLWVVCSFVMIVLELKSVLVWQSFKEKLKETATRDTLLVISTSLVLGRVGLWYLHSLLSQDLSLQIGGYLEILGPLLNLIGLVSLEISIVMIALGLWEMIKSNRGKLKFFIVTFVCILAIFCIFVFLISKTGLGILPSYKGDWNRGLPAVPLLEWQIILAGLFAVSMLVFENKISQLVFRKLDFFICLLIWIGTSVFWLSQPVIPNPSALKPHEPNYEIYPFIDSQTYDEPSQSILIGDGFGGEQVPLRPLYIVFLAFIHMIVGQDYSSVIFVQTLFLAFLPVFLFLLGKELFGRPIGISIALLAVLRDYTSNIVSPFTGNLSYSKVYLSELPTAVLLILFLFLGVRWIRSGFPLFIGFLLGGVLGLAMLLRTQSIVVLPVILLFSILVDRKNIKPLVYSTSLMLLMTFIVVSPWLWRNWKVTGDLIFDNPESQVMNLALRYNRVNGIDWQVARLPGETSTQFSVRLKNIAINAIKTNPSGAAWALANTFINHGVNNILLFPLRSEIKNFHEFVFPSDAFWEKWQGNPSSSQNILIAFFLLLFSLGVTVAWQRNGWLGLLPLGLNLVYNLWTSLALLSGQRFMVTMDWSIYLYYMIGIFSLIMLFLFALNNSRVMVIKWLSNNSYIPVAHYKSLKWHSFIIAGAFFLGSGLSLPLVEKIVPEKYPDLSHDQFMSQLVNSSALENTAINSSCLKRLSNDLVFVQGRAVYPRYYSAGDGERFTDTPGYKVSNESRLVFDIVGRRNYRVVFPLSEVPVFFPHASDIVLIYNHNMKLWFVFVKQGQIEKIYISDKFDRTLCRE